jgi:hypothetical protein
LKRVKYGSKMPKEQASNTLRLQNSLLTDYSSGRYEKAGKVPENCLYCKVHYTFYKVSTATGRRADKTKADNGNGFLIQAEKALKYQASGGEKSQPHYK